MKKLTVGFLSANQHLCKTSALLLPMKHFYLFVFTALLVACQSDQAGSKHMFADFFVRYLETERQLKAHAAFYEGDTLKTARSVTFEKPVYFQGYPMDRRQIEDKTLRYIFNGVGTYDSAFVFQYTDLRGRKQDFNLSMAPIRDFSIKEPVASLRKGFTLLLDASPFDAEESLVLLFTGPNNKSAMAEFKGPFNLTELSVPAVQLVDAEPGLNSLYLVRKRTSQYKTPAMDITASAEYYTKIIDVELVE